MSWTTCHNLDYNEPNIGGTGGGGGSVTLTGDVTGSGASPITTTISANAVTFAKFQQISTNRLLGRATAGTGNVEQITLSSNFQFSGGALAFATDLSVAGKITVGTNPTNSLDVATKQYVDNALAGLNPKAAALVATTANITLSGEQTIDGVLTSASRVLVKNQSTASQNGIYITSSGAWTRTTDMDAWSEVPNAFLFIQQGTTQADTQWVCTSNSGGTIGVTAITFVQFGASASYTADGQGIELSGTIFSLELDGTSLSKSSAGIKVNPSIVPYKSDNLSVFAATTSAQLAGIISDETGTGALVFGTTPTIATPVINGLATGTGVASAATASTIVTRNSNANLYANNAPLNLTSTATSGGTLTLTVSSGFNQLLTGSSNHTVVLPVVSTLTVGHQFLISNDSSGTIVIQSSGGNTVATLSAFQSALVTCVLTSGTGSASWSPRLLLLNLTSLTNWTESNNTYSSQVGVRFLATNAASNVDAVITPKGTGAFYLGAYADGSGLAGNGGNNRGPYAADLQIYRNAANQVASGFYSFTVGFGNRAANTSSIAMGFLSVSSADYAIAIGQSCTASATNAVSIGNSNTVSTAQGVGIGRSNTVSSGGLNYAIGDNNSVTNSNSVNQAMALGGFNTVSFAQGYALGQGNNVSNQGFAIGQTNTSSGSGASTIGENNTASGNVTFAAGKYASSILYGKYAYAGGRITNTGDRQYSKSLLKCQSTSTTPVEAFLDNTSARLSVANNSVYSFTITATAIKSDNTAGATFVRSGAIRKTTTSGSTTLIGSVQTIGTDQSDFGSAPAIVISADTTNGALKMTGASGAVETINWLFNVELTEISN